MLGKISPKLANIAKKSYEEKQADGLLQVGADPFESVKKLIQEMITRLMNEAAEASDQNAWCEKEMKKSKSQKGQKEAEIKKLNSRIGEMEAALAWSWDGSWRT